MGEATRATRRTGYTVRMFSVVSGAKRWVGKLFGVLPRGTRVDPALFPEDEYPVRCLNCGYDLRTLPDGRCPECGETFARGHLLVEQYARGRLPRWDRNRRIAWWLYACSFGVWVAGPAYGVVVIEFVYGGEANFYLAFLNRNGWGWPESVFRVPQLGAIAACLIFITALAVNVAALPRRKNCREVRAAARAAAREMARRAASPDSTAPSPARARRESPDRSRTA